MDFEYWWLLALPLFFLLGWIAARVDIGQLLTETSTLPASYFRGLNFLISEQPDKAIEAFTEALKADSNTLELHFALGSLFRRTGEMDRAIRLHQGVLEREHLDETQRLMAMAELSQDYLKAGLLDRAEEIFLKLTETRYVQSALKALLEIYVREKEWIQAVEAAQRLESLSGKPLGREIAQFHCELAHQKILLGDMVDATGSLQTALSANRNSVRANIMLGDIAAANGQHAEALQLWRAVELQLPEYIELIAARMMLGWRTLGKADEGLAWLREVVRKYQLEEAAQARQLRAGGPGSQRHRARRGDSQANRDPDVRYQATAHHDWPLRLRGHSSGEVRRGLIADGARYECEPVNRSARAGVKTSISTPASSASAPCGTSGGTNQQSPAARSVVVPPSVNRKRPRST